MPNYQNSKIYQIIPVCEHEEGDVYIGATTRNLSERMATHRKITNPCRSSHLFTKYGVENCVIELIELYPCNSKEELKQREGTIIRERNCVNKVIPNRTKKEWETINRDKILGYQKIYFQKNKEYIYERISQKKSQQIINDKPI